MERSSIVLAGGCFWGLQKFLDQFQGILSTQAGYANSVIANCSYRQVCSGMTHAAEAVRVVYDPKQISLRQILDVFFAVINPTTKNRQGNDIGTNYRSGIYYTNEKERAVIETAVRTEQKKYRDAIVTEVLPLENFYPAEEFHQDYLSKNPGGYCHISPVKMHGFPLKSNEELNTLDKES